MIKENILDNLSSEFSIKVLFEEYALLEKEINYLSYFQEEDNPNKKNETLITKIKNGLKKIWKSIMNFFKRIINFFKNKKSNAVEKIAKYFNNKENKKDLEEFENDLKNTKLSKSTKLIALFKAFNKKPSVVKESDGNEPIPDNEPTSNSEINEQTLNEMRLKKPKWLKIINSILFFLNGIEFISSKVGFGMVRSGNVVGSTIAYGISEGVDAIKQWLSKINLGIIFVWITIFKQIFDRINNFGKDIYSERASNNIGIFNIDKVLKLLIKDCENVQKMINTTETNISDLKLKSVDKNESKTKLFNDIMNVKEFSDKLTSITDTITSWNMDSIKQDQISVVVSSIIFIINVDGSEKMKNTLETLRNHLVDIDGYVTNIDDEVKNRFSELPPSIQNILVKFSNALLKLIYSIDNIKNKVIESLKSCRFNFLCLKKSIET